MMSISPIVRQWLTPVNTAFVASLALSLLALLGSTLNRDGMLYVQTAQAFLDGGFSSAMEKFAWPFFPISIAIVSRLTSLGLENAAYLLNALFMAGTCALMVSCADRREPAISWSVCLVTLALPGLNEYRNELLREYGCWFFVMLTFWLALRWSERPHWWGALFVQISLAAAALFRPEALALFPALIAWQGINTPSTERWQRLVMLGGIPIAGAVVLLVLYFGGDLPQGSRLASDLGRLNLDRFDAKAEVLSGALLDYARDQAHRILFFGSLALVPLKLIQKFGVFLVPLAVLIASHQTRALLARYSLFAWGIVAHLLVLAVFVVDLQFLAGRYVGLILLLSAPFVGTGFWLMTQRYPRWRWAILLLAVVMMLANVISTGPGKFHFVNAGHWLAENAVESSRVYIDSRRTAYYAGWRNVDVSERNKREHIERASKNGDYDVFVLEFSRNDPPIDEWLRESGLLVIKQFTHPNHDAVIVATHAAGDISGVMSPVQQNPTK